MNKMKHREAAIAAYQEALIGAEKRMSQKTSYSTSSVYKARSEPATIIKYIMLANDGGILVI